MKVKLLTDVATPEPWVPSHLKTRFKAGNIVNVMPADNIPQDGPDPIRFWVDEPEVADSAYGIGLCDGDFVLVDEEVDTDKDVFNNTYILNHHQISTIIAALRMYQFELAINTLGEWLDIATDGGTIVPLDDDEIDALCERLNANEEGWK